MAMGKRQGWQCAVILTGDCITATGKGRGRREAFQAAMQEARKLAAPLITPERAETARRLFDGLRGNRLGWRTACAEDGRRTVAVELARLAR